MNGVSKSPFIFLRAGVSPQNKVTIKDLFKVASEHINNINRITVADFCSLFNRVSKDDQQSFSSSILGRVFYRTDPKKS